MRCSSAVLARLPGARSIVLAAGVAGLALAAAPLAAASFCVNTAAEIQDALDTSTLNGQADTIRVFAGTYAAVPGGFFVSVADGKSLTIEGGYVGAIGGGCARIYHSPAATVLAGGDDVAPVLRIETDSLDSEIHTFSIRVENLTISGGDDPAYGALDVQPASNEPADVFVVRDIFAGNARRAVHLIERGSIRFENNLVYGTTGDSFDEAVEIAAFGPDVAVIYNNTVTGNQTVGLDVGAVAMDVDIMNNVFWGNAFSDLKISEFPEATYLWNNDVGGGFIVSAHEVNTFHLDPKFLDPASADFRPAFDSPVRNLGVISPPDGLAPTDLLANPRQVGIAPDLGAFELNWIFGDGFESQNLAAWTSHAP